jgi:hypothetical protein
MKPYILIFFLLVLGLNSCKEKEELPEPVEGKPVIFLEGQIDSFPFKLESGENATFGNAAAYRYIYPSSSDTFMIFYFSMNLVDDKKRVLQTFEITLNNHKEKPGIFEEDLNNTIKPGSYSYAYTDISSFPNYNFMPSQVTVSFIDYTSGYSYFSLPHWQGGLNKFKILSVKDEYRYGKHYKVAEVEFKIHLRCMSHAPQYYIPLSAKGFIAFGPA